MCSRLEANKKAIIETMTPDMDEGLVDAAKWGELFPTDPILVIGFSNEPAIRRWGLKPDWAARPIINAKAEEAEIKRTFQPLLDSRCIVPVTGYYEWRVDDGKKIKTLIASGEVMPMAGFVTPDACVVLTCAPSPLLAHIHHRMPAILDAGDVTSWLDPGIDFHDLRPLLKPSGRTFRMSDATQQPSRPPKPGVEPRQASLF